MRYLSGLFLACLACQLALLPFADGLYTIARATVLGKVDNWITSWITTDQFTTILDYMEPKLQVNSTMDQVKSDLETIVLQTLTSSQMLQGVNIGTGFLFTYGGYSGAVNATLTAVMDDIAAFIGQMKAMKTKADAAGWDNEKIFTRAYKMVNIFLTYRCCNIIFCRLEKRIDQYDKTMWAYFNSKLGTIVHFSAMNYTAGNCYP
uniref:Secreted protein n=1 Tax=Panagrellus redivivus TaxID=6233 RepID=A0A7E4V1I5_PANRE